jgi:hypothetical protein
MLVVVLGVDVLVVVVDAGVLVVVLGVDVLTVVELLSVSASSHRSAERGTGVVRPLVRPGERALLFFGCNCRLLLRRAGMGSNSATDFPGLIAIPRSEWCV